MRTGVKNYPIWKAAHIASDVDAHPDQKHFLIDCITRKGTSGSPVIVPNQEGSLLGIYSGRLFNDTAVVAKIIAVATKLAAT